MKNLLKYFLSISLFISLISCETTDLDMLVDPNSISEEDMEIPFLLNNIQVEHGLFYQETGRMTSELMRQNSLWGDSYRDGISVSRLDTPWAQAYRRILKNTKLVNEKVVAEPKFIRHKIVANILSANTLITLVDLWGDVPYSEALTEAIQAPKIDSGASVYQTAESILNNALQELDNIPVDAFAFNDIYFNGNVNKWKALINTLKLKIYYQTRLVDNNAVSKFNAIIASNTYISSNSGNFFFQWNEQLLNPNARHPYYDTSYTSAGVNGSLYIGNTLLNMMRNVNNGVKDPRMAYYFYRQRPSFTPGSGPVANALPCWNLTIPSHYTGPADTFCTIPNGPQEGWWGRDHSTSNVGISPSFTWRTTYGVYPAGGKYDNGVNVPNNSQNLGLNGAGITPILLASTVDFWRADLALNHGGSGSFETHLINGYNKSVSFTSTFVTGLTPPTGVAAYENELINRMNGASTSDKMEVWGQQYLISTFGNGNDSFNAYRLTSYPRNLQKLFFWNPETDPFIRSFLYPASEVAANPNVPQKPNVAVRVFWDTNPVNGFLINN